MFKSYIVTAWRRLIRERLYALINIAGLSVALTACFVIYAWVRYETGYDVHHAHAERLYRAATMTPNSEEQGIASTYPMVRPRVLDQFPEVEISGRIYDQATMGSPMRIAYLDKVSTNDRFYYGDPSVIDLFGIKVLRGDPHGLQRPGTIVITSQTAEKFFGTDDPIGKTLRVGQSETFEVVAVTENIPAQTHFHFDVLATMLSHPWIKGAEQRLWSGVVFHTYIRLKEGSTASELEEKINQLVHNFPNDTHGYGKEVQLKLQPVKDIHLLSDLQYELEPNGSRMAVIWFATIGILILSVAVINFTNLTLARHLRRFREVGIRKVAGASRFQLLTQFVGEAGLLNIIAASIAVLLTWLLAPTVATLAGNNILGILSANPLLPLLVASVILFISLLTGILPALGLSLIRPVSLLRSAADETPGNVRIRKVLLTLQFGVSMVLTICSVVVYQQMTFIHRMKLGYEKDHIVVLNLVTDDLREKYSLLKQSVTAVPSIIGSTAVSQLPTDIQSGENIEIAKNDSRGVYCISVDEDFFDVMQIPIVEADPSLKSIIPNDSVNRFVLTAEAAKVIGWKAEDVLGRDISIRHGNQRPGPVLGVTEDFHFQSLHHAVGPLVIEFNPRDYQYLLVKIKPGNVKETLSGMETVWKKLTDVPFQFMLLDQAYDRLYQSEQRSSTLFLIFTGVALLISMLGLYGLSSFAVERRRKEIGIRKILGAYTGDLLILLTRDFIWLMAISCSVALPLGYLVMQQWLSNFAYQTQITPLLLAGSALFNVALAIITLAFHGLKIQRMGVVESLQSAV